MSEAFSSTVNISFGVRGGLLIRQMHHWAADIFVGSIVVHMARIFFTGAFRKPRELNWIIGVTLLILAILEGFIGYSLPDDLDLGDGPPHRLLDRRVDPARRDLPGHVPVGRAVPGRTASSSRASSSSTSSSSRSSSSGLIGAHLGLLVRQKHTQFAGQGRTENNVVGSPMFPTFMAKTTGFLFMVTGGLRPARGVRPDQPDLAVRVRTTPSKISYAVQPDWYMGWLDGALRIMPSWEWTGWGHTIPFEVLLPAVLFPGSDLQHRLHLAGDRTPNDG